jgi:hypothetical protein
VFSALRQPSRMRDGTTLGVPTRHTGLSMERAKLIVEPAGVAALMTSAPDLSLHGPDAEPVQPRLRPPPIRD